MTLYDYHKLIKHNNSYLEKHGFKKRDGKLYKLVKFGIHTKGIFLEIVPPREKKMHYKSYLTRA